MNMVKKKINILKSLWRWPWLGLMLTGFLFWGCAGQTRQNPPEQVVSSIQTQAKKDKLQEQLFTKGGQATLTEYRDYTVGSEDLLEVAFFGIDELNREVRVNGQGEISLPLVGIVSVAGLNPQKIAAKLMNLYKEDNFIVQPQISVHVKEYRHQRVMVSGAVLQPGSYEMIGPRTLLEMLGKAGGINEKAADVIYVIRSQSASDVARVSKVAAVAGGAKPFSPGSENIIIDLRRLTQQGALELNIPIKSGDVIYVPYARSAYVLGAVNKPGNVFIKDNVTVTQAIAMAGGLNLLLASNSVSIVRFDENGQKVNLSMNLGGVTSGKDADIVMKENDIVYVQENIVRRFLFDVRNLMPGALSMPVPF
jgi:polysaccharide biosynthesis/export protein